MRYIILSICLLGGIFVVNAQIASDALRYSNISYGVSTARSLGVGGSLGALGTDYSVLSTNPAGLGMYRRSEFVISPSVFAAKTTSELLGTSTSEDRTEADFNLANIGAVFVSQPRGRKWKTFNFGIGFNRLANFDQEFYYEGATPATVTDRFLDVANDIGLDQFEAGVAADASAIYEAEAGSGFYISDFSNLNLGALINKNQLVERSGSLNELVFSFAGNYNERLIAGLTIGIPFLTFTEVKTYQESDPTDEIEFFNELEYIERLTTNGIGINAKLGLIFRASQAIRLGAAVHTPTNFGMDDLFTTDLTYSYTDADNDGPVIASSPTGSFDYRLKTPWRYFANAGFIIGRSGFISAEVEYVDHSGSTFDLTSDSNSPEDLAYQNDLNDEVLNSFQSALNIRIGGEWAISQFRLRGGYQLLGATANENELGGVLSLGAGVRGKNVYLDLGYQRATSENVYSPYLTSFANEPIIDNKINASRYLMTIGYKF
ncbi:MAG: OmpP1/FadL family transporter [Saprospiraceae bacterium]